MKPNDAVLLGATRSDVEAGELAHMLYGFCQPDFIIGGLHRSHAETSSFNRRG